MPLSMKAIKFLMGTISHSAVVMFFNDDCVSSGHESHNFAVSTVAVFATADKSPCSGMVFGNKVWSDNTRLYNANSDIFNYEFNDCVSSERS